MNKKYDLVVIGAGLSSLMFLNRYLKKFKKHSVLILESKKSIKKDQTFCVWEGPGLDSIQKNFNLKPKKTWNEILIKNQDKNISRTISPYQYVCFDGYETFNRLIKEHANQVEIKRNILVDKIEKKHDVFNIFCKNKLFQGHYVVDSRNNDKDLDVTSVHVKQAFVGHEIDVPKDTFSPDQATLMSFKDNSEEVEFTYILPFSSKKALIETTVFSKNPNLNRIAIRHKELLKAYKDYKILRTEKAIIPMAIMKDKTENAALRIGTNAGMVRPSSGYSMRRIASWILNINIVKLNEVNHKYYQYKQDKFLNWLDSIFLKVIYFYPDQGPYLFMQLFSSVSMPSLIRFLSDKPSILDLIKVLWSMPKILMIKGMQKNNV
ncbi:MAG: lycopene cyclase family protein [Methylophilaceae bacterium]